MSHPDQQQKFLVEINGGPTQAIVTKTTQYGLAAMAALAMLDYEKKDDYDVVKIWARDLIPEYGPYFYAFDGYNLGKPEEDRKW